MKHPLLLLTIILLMLTAGITQAQDTANWTIMHYGAVDNDLEGAAFNDYYEMQVVGSGDGVNIVAQFDRAEGYDSRFGDWTDTRRFYIEAGEVTPDLDVDGKRAALVDFFVAAGYGDAETLTPQVTELDEATVNSIYENNNLGARFDQTPLEELGEVDMGDPQSLFDFIAWSAANFPAEHYMLIIGSHGGGWRGIGPDYGNESSMLELPEIDAALAAAREQLGIDTFDIIGFDACLMGLTDVAVTLAPHADYVLFSQEVIPGNGWEYTNSIQDMKDNPDWDAFQVGANIVDRYMEYYAGPGARTKVGLSLVETAGLPNLLGSLENFSGVIGADAVELLSALGTARNNSQIFGGNLGDRAEFYSYVDLRDFMTWFSVQTTITEDAFSAAQEVIAAYDSAVVYSLADSKLPRATGLGIYLPPSPPYYTEYGANYPAVAPPSMAFWQDYLNGFYSTIVSELDGSALQLEITSTFTVSETGSVLDSPVVFFDAAGKGVVDLNYTVTYVQEDGSRIVVDTAPISYTTTLPTGETVIEYPNELTPSTFTWGVEVPFITDGTNSLLGLMQSTPASGSEANIWGTYVNQEGSQPAFLVVDTAANTVSGVLAIADSAPYEVRPSPGDQFIVDLITISAEGEVSVVPLADSPLTFGVEPFRIAFQPATTGTYELGLTIGDLAGNKIYRSTAFNVDNDSVDGSLRGYTDTNEGVYFQYPFTWGASYSITSEEGAVTQYVSDNTAAYSISVDTYFDTDPATVIADVLNAAGSDAELLDVTLVGLSAVSASYDADFEDGTTGSIVLIAIVNEAAETIVLFTIAAPTQDEAVSLANLVDASLYFFAPVE